VGFRAFSSPKACPLSSALIRLTEAATGAKLAHR
jgi:hypothetical protein